MWVKSYKATTITPLIAAAIREKSVETNLANVWATLTLDSNTLYSLFLASVNYTMGAGTIIMWRTGGYIE